MTEKERREDEALKNCIQEAYGLSDEQLLAELEELEASLSDDEFAGAEDRIYARIMQREAEREESSISVEEVATSAEIPASNPTPIRKSSKKKRWLVVGIAAALVVGASVSTIGGNNYFLKQRVKQDGIVLNSGQNIVKTGNLQDAYLEAESKLDIPILKMNYIPDNMIFEKVIIENQIATFVFTLNHKYIYFIQEKRDEKRSVGLESDRKSTDFSIKNEWIKEKVIFEENYLSDGEYESSILINSENASYKIIGKLSKEEMKKITEKLYY